MNGSEAGTTSATRVSLIGRCNPSRDAARSFMQNFRAQFGRPVGFWGSVAGMIMANRPSNQERNAWAVSLLDVRPDDRVLEIGFGPGLAIERISQIAAHGLVAGVDHSETMLRQARKRNAAAIRRGRVDLRLGGVRELPAFGEPFDKILAVNSFQFWDEPLDRLGELRGLLQPGGVIAIAMQPRWRGASDEDARKVGRGIATQFAEAGFSQVRQEFKLLKPVSAVCVLGTG